VRTEPELKERIADWKRARDFFAEKGQDTAMLVAHSNMKEIEWVLKEKGE